MGTFFRKSAVLQGKRPWRTGEKVAKIQVLLFSCLEVRGGSVPSKRGAGFVCHIFGSARHTFCRNPLRLTDFYAIRTPIVWHLLGAYFFGNTGGGGWSELFSSFLAVGVFLLTVEFLCLHSVEVLDTFKAVSKEVQLQATKLKLLGQKSRRTKVPRILRVLVPNFAPNFAPNFPRNF